MDVLEGDPYSEKFSQNLSVTRFLHFVTLQRIIRTEPKTPLAEVQQLGSYKLEYVV